MCIYRVVVSEIDVAQVPARVDLAQVVGGAEVRLVVPQPDASQLGDLKLEGVRPAGMCDNYISRIILAIDMKSME